MILEQAAQRIRERPAITAMTASTGSCARLGPRDFREPPEPVAKMTLRGQSWRSPKARKDIARELETACRRGSVPSVATRASDARRSSSSLRVASRARLSGRRRAPEARRRSSRASRRRSPGCAVRSRRRARARSPGRSTACSPSSRSCGYVDEWTLTEKGELLTRDLQRVGPPRRRVPEPRLVRRARRRRARRRRLGVRLRVARDARRRRGAADAELAKHERRIADLFQSLQRTRERARGRAPQGAGRRVHGADLRVGARPSLEDILEDRETSAGDFVRSTKQVIDLLQQLRQSRTATSPTRSASRSTASSAASSRTLLWSEPRDAAAPRNVGHGR